MLYILYCMYFLHLQKIYISRKSENIYCTLLLNNSNYCIVSNRTKNWKRLIQGKSGNWHAAGRDDCQFHCKRNVLEILFWFISTSIFLCLCLVTISTKHTQKFLLIIMGKNGNNFKRVWRVLKLVLKHKTIFTVTN